MELCVAISFISFWSFLSLSLSLFLSLCPRQFITLFFSLAVCRFFISSISNSSASRLSLLLSVYVSISLCPLSTPSISLCPLSMPSLYPIYLSHTHFGYIFFNLMALSMSVDNSLFLSVGIFLSFISGSSSSDLSPSLLSTQSFCLSVSLTLCLSVCFSLSLSIYISFSLSLALSLPLNYEF